MASSVWGNAFRTAGSILVATGRLLGKGLYRGGRAVWRFLRNTLFPAIGWLYTRLPLRWAVGGTLAVLLAVGIGGWHMWSGWVQPALTAGPPELETYPRGAWTELARRLNEAERLEDAVDVTREILARGGIATTDGARVVVPAIGPGSDYQAYTLETVHLAMEARRRRETGSLTVAEYAQMLHSFGWSVRDGRNGGLKSPGDVDFDKGHSYVNGILDPGTPFDGIDRSGDWQSARNQARQQTDRVRRDAQKAAMEAAIAEREAKTQQHLDEVMAAIKAVRDEETAVRQAMIKATREERAALQKSLDDTRVAYAHASAPLDEARRARREARRDIQQEFWRKDEAQTDREKLLSKIGPNYVAGEQFMEFLAIWAHEAARRPDDPHSFTPLFLAEMARLQDPPVDLLGSRDLRPGRAGSRVPVDLKAAPRSQQLRLTMLEMQLIGAAFTRLDTNAVASRPVVTRLQGLASTTMGWVIADARATGTAPACSALKDEIGKFSKSLAEVGVAGAGEGVGKALDIAAKARMGADSAKVFEQLMNAMGLVTKVIKLAAYYETAQVSVTVDPANTHKPPEGKYAVRFTATAGVDATELEDYKKQNNEGWENDPHVRDCLSSLNLPTYADIRDVAKDAENWLVEWSIVEGAPDHAMAAPRKFNDYHLAGRQAMKLKRVSDSSAEAAFVVELKPEHDAADRKGPIARTYVTARAAVDAAQPPGVGILANTYKGIPGLVDALAELAAGWVQVMAKPKAYATVEVEYHSPSQCYWCPCDERVTVCGDGCPERGALVRGTEAQCAASWPDREQRLYSEWR